MKKLLIALTCIMLMINIIPTNVNASSSKNIKINDFVKLLVQSMELEVNKMDKEPYIESALKQGILKSNDFKDYTKYITRTDVAVLLNRADEYLRGETIGSDLVEIMIEKRISDIDKIKNNKKESVAKIMAKGIIKGYSNGDYIQKREFRGNKYITKSGAKNVIELTLNPKKRAPISPDGQLIRTTNLPKNYKDFDYILECFPNSFYEQKHNYQITKYYYKPIELEHYASPKKIKEIKTIYPMIEKYGDLWMKKIEANLRLRLNVDYSTVNDEWINELAQTYWYSKNKIETKKENIDDVKKYVKAMKKNKVKIVSDIIAVEPSTLHFNASLYVRVYVKFKVQADSFKDMTSVIYGDTNLINLKNNTWHYGIYEIGLGSSNASSDGFDFAITRDNLSDYRFNVQ